MALKRNGGEPTYASVLARNPNAAKNTLGGWWYVGWQYRHAIKKPFFSSSGKFKWASFNKRKPYTGSSLDLIELGSRVEAEKAHTGVPSQLFPGKVVRMNTDLTYSVQFDDGHYEQSLQRYQLRLKSREIQTRDHRTKNELGVDWTNAL